MKSIMTSSMVGALTALAVVAMLGAGSGSSGGDLGPYLTGFFDAAPADGEVAELWLVNPTSSDLEALVVIFDDDQNPVDCERVFLSPNDVDDFDLNTAVVEEGMVKVVSVTPGNGKNVQVRSGIVGWMRHETGEGDALADTLLRPLPVALLHANGNFELNLIVDYVNENCI